MYKTRNPTTRRGRGHDTNDGKKKARIKGKARERTETETLLSLSCSVVLPVSRWVASLVALATLRCPLPFFRGTSLWIPTGWRVDLCHRSVTSAIVVVCVCFLFVLYLFYYFVIVWYALHLFSCEIHCI